MKPEEPTGDHQETGGEHHLFVEKHGLPWAFLRYFPGDVHVAFFLRWTLRVRS